MSVYEYLLGIYTVTDIDNYVRTGCWIIFVATCFIFLKDFKGDLNDLIYI